MKNKRHVFIYALCVVAGAVLTYGFTRSEIQLQRKLTARILRNAIDGMEASQNLAESCTGACNTVTACFSDLRQCNIQEETEKLDAFSQQKEKADERIRKANEEIKEIIEEVSANR